MSAPEQQPMFVARDAYRRRRFMDAARMLPVLGIVLVLLPLLWGRAGMARDTAVDGIYLFALWFGLVAGAMVLSRGLKAGRPAEDTSGNE